MERIIAVSRLDANGRVMLPSEIRTMLGDVNVGERIVYVEVNGNVEIRKA